MKSLERTISSTLANRLREDILCGTFEGGSALRQESIAEKYQVSRIPVREALLQLESQGLVSMVAHKGFTVRSMSRNEAMDIYRLRLAIEPELISSVLVRKKSEDFTETQQFLEQMQAEFSANGATNHYADLHMQFHISLFKETERFRTYEILQRLYVLSERYIRLHLAEHSDQSEKEHNALLEAVWLDSGQLPESRLLIILNTHFSMC